MTDLKTLTLGRRIQALRREQGMTQDALAERMGVTPQAVSKWENDLTSPDTINLIRLADILDADVEYLATGNHSKHTPVPQVVTVVQKVDNIVEKVVEKPVIVEKTVEVERLVETIVEKPVIRKVIRTKYLRNPFEFLLLGLICFGLGILIGRFF